MILIIDDDSAIRSSLSFMLKRAKYDVQAVPGPKEAIEIVRSVAPQLILMDMNFTLSTTGEEGLVLLRQVKIFQPHVPVILMTAWGSIQLAVKGMQAGVAAVILDVVFDLGGKVLKTRSWVYIALMVAAFVANTVFDVNVVVVILAAAVFGVVLALVQWKKGGAK